MHSSRLNLFIGFVLLLGAFPARAQEGDRPNIIFIFSDDHATEALGANTLVIYGFDQGFFLGEKGWFDKRWMYEESLVTPLIVRWPRVTPPSSETDALVQNLDFAQTMLDIAGSQASPEMQGRSLVPLMRGETPADWRASIYYHYYEFPEPHHVHPHEGVRTDQYKLIGYYTLDQWEFFDLEADPDELHSAYEDAAYARIVPELKSVLDRLKQRFRIPSP